MEKGRERNTENIVSSRGKGRIKLEKVLLRPIKKYQTNKTTKLVFHRRKTEFENKLG